MLSRLGKDNVQCGIANFSKLPRTGGGASKNVFLNQTSKNFSAAPPNAYMWGYK